MKKLITILISVLMAFVIISSGYGLWQKELVIEGNIHVVPDPEVIASLESSINDKYDEIVSLIEQQRIEEEQRLLKEQELLEEQKRLEEEKLLEEQRRLEEEKLKENGTAKDENVNGKGLDNSSEETRIIPHDEENQKEYEHEKNSEYVEVTIPIDESNNEEDKVEDEIEVVNDTNAEDVSEAIDSIQPESNE